MTSAAPMLSRLVAGLPPAGGPLYGVAELIGELWYRLRPVARPRLGATCDGWCRRSRPIRSRERRVRAAATDPRALERLVRSAFRHTARYYLEVARNAERHPGLGRRAARARYAGAHRRGRRPGQGRPVRRAAFRLGGDAVLFLAFRVGGR